MWDLTVCTRFQCGSGLAREGVGSVYISIPVVTAAGGSALTAGHFWKDPKVTKRSSPHHSAPRLGSVCPHSGFGAWAAAMGHPWPSAANPASCRVTHAPKPAFGQRGFTGRLRSKSKARSNANLLFCGSGLAREGGLTADPYLPDAPHSKCGSGLARKGGLTADPYLPDAPHSKCGSGLARKGGPTADPYLPDAPHSKCGSGLARDGGLTADPYLPDAPHSKCGSGLARDGGPTADHPLPDAPRPKCGSGLARDGGLTADPLQPTQGAIPCFN